MEWPPGKLGGGLTGGFETEARSRRYRLIAEACQRRGLMSVFLGHHADDQAETVLMRMVHNLGSIAGLQGMSSVRPMPCTEGLYGADPRGPPLSMHQPKDPAKDTLPSWRKPPIGDLPKPIPPTISDEKKPQRPFQNEYGILMFRPFLDYPKSRLVATCKSKEVPYVTDPTNEDPAATSRNTCRHLNSHYTLPRALQRESLLRLAEKAKVYEEDICEKSASVLRRADIVFDIRSGVLDIRFPRSVYPSIDVMARTLESIIDVVNPLKPDQQRPRGAPFQKARIASAMFPQLRKTQMELPKPDGPPFKFGLVTMTKFEMSKSGRPHLSGTAWQMSRRVPMLREFEICTQFFPQSQGYRAPRELVNSEWMLWDGRYWIKLLGIPLQDINGWHVRFLRPDDLVLIRKIFWTRIGRYATKHLNSLLSTAAPDKIRLTLPVIVDNQGRMRFLPTLGFTIPIRFRESNPAPLDYLIKYKAIDPLLLSQLKLAINETTDERRKAAQMERIKERAMSLWAAPKETRDIEEQTEGSGT